jgi:hypothetical protein
LKRSTSSERERERVTLKSEAFGPSLSVRSAFRCYHRKSGPVQVDIWSSHQRPPPTTMSSPTAAYRSPFRLSPVSPLQSSFLSLPLELRYTVYTKIFQPRTYHYKIGIGFINVHSEECRYVIPTTCQCPRPCFLSRHTCSCSFGGVTSLLRTCQQIYVEAQPHFLLSAPPETACDISLRRIQPHGRQGRPVEVVPSKVSLLVPIRPCSRRLPATS